MPARCSTAAATRRSKSKCCADDGRRGRAIVPSAASTGWPRPTNCATATARATTAAACCMAVAHVNDTIAPALPGFDPADQSALIAAVRAGRHAAKSKLGGNSIAGRVAGRSSCGARRRGRAALSACQRAAGNRCAGHRRIPPRMPLPMTNLICGGLHAGGNLDFQDFLIMPVGRHQFCRGLEWMVPVPPPGPAADRCRLRRPAGGRRRGLRAAAEEQLASRGLAYRRARRGGRAAAGRGRAASRSTWPARTSSTARTTGCNATRRHSG